MSGVTSVLLASDILVYLYVWEELGPFTRKQKELCHRLIQEIGKNHQLRGVISEATLDLVFIAIEAKKGIESAKQVLEELRTTEGIEIPANYSPPSFDCNGKFQASTRLAAINDQNTLYQELFYALRNRQVSALVTSHLPKRYAEDFPQQYSDNGRFQVLTAEKFLDQLSRDRLEKIWQEDVTPLYPIEADDAKVITEETFHALSAVVEEICLLWLIFESVDWEDEQVAIILGVIWMIAFFQSLHLEHGFTADNNSGSVQEQAVVRVVDLFGASKIDEQRSHYELVVISLLAIIKAYEINQVKEGDGHHEAADLAHGAKNICPIFFATRSDYLDGNVSDPSWQSWVEPRGEARGLAGDRDGLVSNPMDIRQNQAIWLTLNHPDISHQISLESITKRPDILLGTELQWISDPTLVDLIRNLTRNILDKNLAHHSTDNFFNLPYNIPDKPKDAEPPLNPVQTGLGGYKEFIIHQGNGIYQGSGTLVIKDFGGVGKGTNPSIATIAEVDRLVFDGIDLIVRNLLLTQNGDDLEVSFDGVANVQVVLKDFALENLENLRRNTGATINLGNILFAGDSEIQDSFDVIDANARINQVLRPNTVTFLNDLDNNVQGFDDSDDVINAQGGNDILWGGSGNDTLRGGSGNDILYAVTGADFLVGNTGDDLLYLGPDAEVDTVIYRHGDGTDVIYEFNRGAGGDQLNFAGIAAIDIVVNGGSTFFRVSDGIEGNGGFGAGQVLVELQGVIGFTPDNISLNLGAQNSARCLFS